MINLQFASLPLSRDAFLSDLIHAECHHLENELKGKPALSSKANRHISAQLNRKINKGLENQGWEGVKQINLLLDKETADRLNGIVADKNLVRDAFINRLFLFLAAPPNMFKWFDEPVKDDFDFSRLDRDQLYELENFSVSPIEYVSQALRTPFYWLRKSFELAGVANNEEGLYLVRLPEKYTGFTVYMEDIEVPGTKENENHKVEMAEFLKDLHNSM